MYYIGIDWSTKHEDICIINQEGQVIKEFRISVTKSGFKKLLLELEKLNTDASVFKIGIETEKNILVDYLINLGFEVFSLNPLSVKRFKEIYSISGKKDDKFDALMMAQMMHSQHDKLRPVQQSSNEVSELAIHCQTIDNLISQRTRAINQIKSHLNRYFPVFLIFFKNFKSNVTLNTLMAIANPYETQNLTKEMLLVKLDNIPYFYSKRKVKFCDLLLNENINFKNPINKAYTIKVQMFIEQLFFLNKQIKELQKIISEIFENHEYSGVFKSLPGAGERLAPAILAHLGDNHKRFTTRDQFRCYAGTAPVTEQSGVSFRKVKIRRACNKSFRNTLHVYSFCTIKYVQWAREYYDKQRLKKGHNAAIRALSNKWAKIIFSMWKNKTSYDENKFKTYQIG